MARNNSDTTCPKGDVVSYVGAMRSKDLKPLKKDSILIYAPVPLYRTQEGLLLENQACNGLRLWAENFASVRVMMPVETGTPLAGWQPLETVGPNLERIKIIEMPTAYRPDQFVRNFKETRARIKSEIEDAQYLSFSIGGLFGDWGSVACYEAHKQGRRYAVWTDRVESEVIRRMASSGIWRRRLKAYLTYKPTAWLEKFLIRRAALGLFHGKETYDAYAPYCKRAEVVHDIHFPKSSHISPHDLAAKMKAVSDGPLKIGYIGRSDAMKGPSDWIRVLEKVRDAGLDFEAFWMGEGSETESMKTQIASAGLQDQVKLLGFVKDRAEVLQAFRVSDIFLFCHKTPESPRCLIEALISGSPIVGYEGAFAKDLISNHQGGVLVPLDDVETLASRVGELIKDRAAVAKLIAAAAKDGAPYDDESVFEHRSDVIKKYL